VNKLQPGGAVAAAIAATAGAAGAGVAGSHLSASGIPGLMTTPVGGGMVDKLELARKLALKINAQKNLGPGSAGGAPGFPATQVTAEAVLSGRPSTQPVLTARMVAEQLATKLNNRLNYIPEERDEEEEQREKEEESFTKYEEELEINDFPQHTRWKVTSKEALAQISEYSEAGITVRGTYFAPKAKVPEGERKLFLAIESTSELAVSKAKAEITRLIKEELVRAQTAHHSGGSRARYKVL